MIKTGSVAAWLHKGLKVDTNKEVLCCSEDGNIIIVNKNEKFWWVLGYSTLDKEDLPDWKETVIKYHGAL